VNEDTLKEMRAKHPEADLPKLPFGAIPDPVRFDVDLVRKKVEGFPTGSAAGASGTRPQFLKDILSCANKAVGDAALATLTRLTNHMVAGLAPRELAPFIAGAPLMALVKQGGGLRPIAIGETIRRLVSKCCCEATTEDAKIFFGPLQVGCLVGLKRQCTRRGGWLRSLAMTLARSCSKLISQMRSTWSTGLR
jgi:hypothetical protein